MPSLQNPQQDKLWVTGFYPSQAGMEKNGLGQGQGENRPVLEKLLDGRVVCCIEFYHWHYRRVSRNSVLVLHQDMEAARQEIFRKVQIPVIVLLP